jgi:hypothetical protein
MTPRLNSTTRVSNQGGMPTIELLKVWAELARVVDNQQSQITALEARVAALEALHP